ncbi:MAG: hypothetical protein ACD_46C00611G0001 [uncultured bacterium]|nr:MAG: hypothetical protein ACD_46C00611G0001 [uncultured bacterium]
MKKITGTSLLEVLLALFLLSMLLLNFDATQMMGIKKAKANYYWQVAMHQIQSLMNVLQLYKNDSATQQIIEWNRQNQIMLPQGKGEVVGEYPNQAIQIFWGEIKSTCEKNKIGMSGCIKIEMGSV